VARASHERVGQWLHWLGRIALTGRAVAVPLWVLVANGCDVTLVRGLTREEAREALRALDRSGVVGRVIEDDRGGSRVRIDVNDSAVADGVAALTTRREQAQCSSDGPSEAGSRWIETPGEERARHAERLSRQLERSLSRLPGVVEAHVHLSLPFGMSSLAEAQTPAAASVLLVRSEGAGALNGAANELVAGSVAGLSPSTVRVIETRLQPSAAAEPKFSRIGSVVVTRESASTLKWWLAGSLGLDMLLAAALLRPIWRGRKRASGERGETVEAAETGESSNDGPIDGA
jgi:type III secretion protein J